MAVSIVRPAFYHRFLVICLPSWIMMTAIGAQEIPRRVWRGVMIACVCILSLAATVVLYTRVTEDWRGAVSYLIANTQADDRVLYYQPVGYFAGENYRDDVAGGEFAPLEACESQNGNEREQRDEGNSDVSYIDETERKT